MKTVDDFIVALIDVNEKAKKARSIEYELSSYQHRTILLQSRLDRCLKVLHSLNITLGQGCSIEEFRDIFNHVYTYLMSEEDKEKIV